MKKLWARMLAWFRKLQGKITLSLVSTEESRKGTLIPSSISIPEICGKFDGGLSVTVGAALTLGHLREIEWLNMPRHLVIDSVQNVKYMKEKARPATSGGGYPGCGGTDAQAAQYANCRFSNQAVFENLPLRFITFDSTELYERPNSTTLHAPNAARLIVVYLIVPILQKRNNLCDPRGCMIQMYTKVKQKIGAIEKLQTYWQTHTELPDHINRLAVIEREKTLYEGLERSMMSGMTRMYDFFTNCIKYLISLEPTIEKLVIQEREAQELRSMRAAVDQLERDREKLEHNIVTEFVTAYEETRIYMGDVETAIASHDRFVQAVPTDVLLADHSRIEAYLAENQRLEATITQFTEKAHFRDDVIVERATVVT